MGNSSKKPDDHDIISSYDHRHWTVKQQLTYCQLWVNNLTNCPAEAYELELNTSSEELDKYEFRSQNNRDIVGVYQVIPEEGQFLCSKGEKMHVLTQRIPIRLQAINDLTQNQALHVLTSAYSGYNTIGSHYGPVKPDPSCIGFTEVGKAKVWVNSNLSLNTPLHKEQSDDNQLEKRNRQYVGQLFNIVESRTIGGLPRLRDIYIKKQPTYFQALNILEHYTETTGIKVPVGIRPRHILDDNPIRYLKQHNQFQGTRSAINQLAGPYKPGNRNRTVPIRDNTPTIFPLSPQQPPDTRAYQLTDTRAYQPIDIKLYQPIDINPIQPINIRPYQSSTGAQQQLLSKRRFSSPPLFYNKPQPVPSQFSQNRTVNKLQQQRHDPSIQHRIQPIVLAAPGEFRTREGNPIQRPLEGSFRPGPQRLKDIQSNQINTQARQQHSEAIKAPKNQQIVAQNSQSQQKQTKSNGVSKDRVQGQRKQKHNQIKDQTRGVQLQSQKNDQQQKEPNTETKGQVNEKGVSQRQWGQEHRATPSQITFGGRSIQGTQNRGHFQRAFQQQPIPIPQQQFQQPIIIPQQQYQQPVINKQGYQSRQQQLSNVQQPYVQHSYPGSGLISQSQQQPIPIPIHSQPLNGVMMRDQFGRTLYTRPQDLVQPRVINQEVSRTLGQQIVETRPSQQVEKESHQQSLPNRHNIEPQSKSQSQEHNQIYNQSNINQNKFRQNGTQKLPEKPKEATSHQQLPTQYQHHRQEEEISRQIEEEENGNKHLNNRSQQQRQGYVAYGQSQQRFNDHEPQNNHNDDPEEYQQDYRDQEYQQQQEVYPQQAYYQENAREKNADHHMHEDQDQNQGNQFINHKQPQEEVYNERPETQHRQRNKNNELARGTQETHNQNQQSKDYRLAESYDQRSNQQWRSLDQKIYNDPQNYMNRSFDEPPQRESPSRRQQRQKRQMQQLQRQKPPKSVTSGKSGNSQLEMAKLDREREKLEKQREQLQALRNQQKQFWDGQQDSLAHQREDRQRKQREREEERQQGQESRRRKQEEEEQRWNYQRQERERNRIREREERDRRIREEMSIFRIGDNSDQLQHNQHNNEELQTEQAREQNHALNNLNIPNQSANQQNINSVNTAYVQQSFNDRNEMEGSSVQNQNQQGLNKQSGYRTTSRDPKPVIPQFYETDDIQRYIRKKYNIKNEHPTYNPTHAYNSTTYSHNYTYETKIMESQVIPMQDHQFGRHNLLTFMPKDREKDIMSIQAENSGRESQPYRRADDQGFNVQDMERNLLKFEESRHASNKEALNVVKTETKVEDSGNGYKISNKPYQSSYKNHQTHHYNSYEYKHQQTSQPHHRKNHEQGYNRQLDKYKLSSNIDQKYQKYVEGKDNTKQTASRMKKSENLYTNSRKELEDDDRKRKISGDYNYSTNRKQSNDYDNKSKTRNRLEKYTYNQQDEENQDGIRMRKLRNENIGTGTFGNSQAAQSKPTYEELKGMLWD